MFSSGFLLMDMCFERVAPEIRGGPGGFQVLAVRLVSNAPGILQTSQCRRSTKKDKFVNNGKSVQENAE